MFKNTNFLSTRVQKRRYTTAHAIARLHESDEPPIQIIESKYIEVSTYYYYLYYLINGQYKQIKFLSVSGFFNYELKIF